MKKKKESPNGLGRVFIPDERDKKYSIRSILPKKETTRHFKYWWPGGWWGNQGNTPQCVAYAWLHWLEDGGVTQNHKAPPVINPTDLYNDCQKNDYWAGENYEGTSVRAGAKVLQEMGYISSYYWAWTLEEAIQAVMHLGPVVIGVDWYSDMSWPDENNIIRASGIYQGGHAVEINGVNLETRMARIKNSWGRSYGNNGHAYIPFEDLERLFRNNGEVCIATEIKKQ